MVRRRYSAYVELGLTDRLRLYAAALGRQGRRVSLAGLLEAALWEYLESRCDGLGAPRPGARPEPEVRYTSRGRPSIAALERRFRPRLERTAGRYPGDRRPRRVTTSS